MSNEARLHSLPLMPEHPCSYFPTRTAKMRAAWAEELDPLVYHSFMDVGCRRSGKVIYAPACDGCRLCVPLRVPVGTFHPDRSQRRCRTRNQDLSLEVRLPVADDESFSLYQRYQRDWHGRAPTSVHEADPREDRESFEKFLFDSPVATVEMRYRDPAGKLLAVGICDLSERSLSTVYFYHEPSERKRGLGTFGALVEIEFARSRSVPFYYLGFWVRGCPSMEYKNRFRPCEVLRADGTWVPLKPDATNDVSRGSSETATVE